jgi:uncharacterized protein
VYSQADLMPWVRALHQDIPELKPYDAHVHIGLNDPAALLATQEEALSALEEVDSHALIFPLMEPAGYTEANRRLLDWSEEHRDRLRVLARVDPADDPLAEAKRCLDGGAVGLKLHPKGEGFEISDERLDGVFGLADEHHLPVMIHAGVGSPEVGPDTLQRARDHPGARLILAHCAIGSFDRIIHDVPEVPNVFFDTSWWSPADIWALFRMVPPSRILYASDVPFASPAAALVMTGRLAIEAGLTAEQIRGVMGGQLERLVAHDEPLALGPVPEAVQPLAPELERLYVTLLTAVEPMLRGSPAGQGLDLAQAAAQVPAGPHADVIECVAALLTMQESKKDPDPLRASRTPGFDLVQMAAVAARTPRATSPSLDDIRRLAEDGEAVA